MSIRNSGSGNYLSPSSFPANSPLSIRCWVKMSVDTNAYSTFVSLNSSSSTPFLVGTGVNGNTLIAYAQNTEQASSYNLTVDSVWHHVVYTWNGTTVNIYVDGVNVLQVGLTQSGTTTSLTILSDTFSKYFNGSIYGVAIWQRELKLEQVKADRFIVTPQVKSDLWGWWLLDTNSDTTDRSGNSRNLTTTGTLTTDSSKPNIPVSVPQRAKGFFDLFVPNVVSLFNSQRFYPLEVYLVLWSDRANLQTRLDTYGMIRLEPDKDYISGSPSSITLKTNQRIYGLFNDFPQVIVAPGCNGAVLNGIRGQVVFPSSSIVTYNNVFKNMSYSGFTVNGASLENNLFLNTSNFNVDTSTTGYWRNNRIMKILSQTTSNPMIVLKGDLSRPCNGNVFLWANSLNAGTDSAAISGQDNLTMVAFEVETYDTDYKNALRVRNTNDLTLFSIHGVTTTGVALDIGSESVWIHSGRLGSFTEPQAILRSTNTNSLVSLSYSTVILNDEATSANRAKLFVCDEGEYPKTFVINGVSLPTSISAPALAGFKRAATSKTSVPWERPTFAPLPDPGGANWNVGLASQTSSLSFIQSALDTNNIVYLSGIYYIDAPIILRTNQKIIGNGAKNTAIIAKNNSFDIIQFVTPGASGIIIVDITLQGGLNGLLLNTANTQVLNSSISNVTFRNMVDSGINFKDIYAWDNNWLEHVNFIDCGNGIKQSTTYSGGGDSSPYLSYMDKCVFFQHQYIRCGTALNLKGGRASGGNLWVNCLFKDNTSKVIVTGGHDGMVMANCDFINNGGNPVVVCDGYTTLLSCYFYDNGSQTANGFIDGISMSCEGCTFERAGSSTTTITSSYPPTWIDVFAHPNNMTSYYRHCSHFYNCNSINVPMGTMLNGLLFNNRFGADSSLSVEFAYRVNSSSNSNATTQYNLSSTPVTTAPIPQVLNGSIFSNELYK